MSKLKIKTDRAQLPPWWICRVWPPGWGQYIPRQQSWWSCPGTQILDKKSSRFRLFLALKIIIFYFILNLMKKSKKQTLGGSKSESILGWLGHPEFQKSNSASVSYFRRSKIVMFMRHWLIWSIIDCTESSEDNEAVNFKVKKINNFCWTTYEVIITFNCTAKILVLQDKK